MVILKACVECGSNKIVNNGKTKKGKQQYHCKECGVYRTLGATQVYSKEQKEEILKAYKERSSLRGINRIYGVAVSTLIDWLKKNPEYKTIY